MKTSKKDLAKGSALLMGFVIILVLLFSPVIKGQKPINFFDDLFNSISKGSVYYIADLASEAGNYEGRKVTSSLDLLTRSQADEILRLFATAGIQANELDNKIVIESDLAHLVGIILNNADDLFHNEGEKIVSKYGIDEKIVLYYWWLTLKSVEKDLNKSKRFEEAKFVHSVITKAVECSFNYYGIDPLQISTEIPLVVFSLIFYVVYTLWFGYSIMFIFIGFGLRLDH